MGLQQGRGRGSRRASSTSQVPPPRPRPRPLATPRHPSPRLPLLPRRHHAVLHPSDARPSKPCPRHARRMSDRQPSRAGAEEPRLHRPRVRLSPCAGGRVRPDWPPARRVALTQAAAAPGAAQGAPRRAGVSRAGRRELEGGGSWKVAPWADSRGAREVHVPSVSAYRMPSPGGPSARGYPREPEGGLSAGLRAGSGSDSPRRPRRTYCPPCLPSPAPPLPPRLWRRQALRRLRPLQVRPRGPPPAPPALPRRCAG